MVSMVMLAMPVMPHHHHGHSGRICMRHDLCSHATAGCALDVQGFSCDHQAEDRDDCCSHCCCHTGCIAHSLVQEVPADGPTVPTPELNVLSPFLLEAWMPLLPALKKESKDSHSVYREKLHGTTLVVPHGLRAPPTVLVG